MRKHLLQLWSNQLIQGTSIFFAGSMVVNFGGFVYHLLVARLLGPVDYGILSALLGLMYFASIPIGGLDLLVTKIVSSFDGNNDPSSCRAFLGYILRALFKVGLVLTPSLALASGMIQNFLHLPDVWGVMLTWVTVLIWLVITVFRSVLKGQLRFKELVINQVIEIFLRVGFSVLLIVMVQTNYLFAQAGTVLASVVGLALLIYQLRRLVMAKPSAYVPGQWPIKSVGGNSFLLSAAYTSMYSLDVILVKHFFAQNLAGIYAALATTGKIIFFAEGAIGSALIPVVARKSSRPHLARKELTTLLVVCLILGLPIIGVYWLLPDLVVNVLFTRTFSAASSYLLGMGTAMFFYSLANLSSSFLLSLDNGMAATISGVGLVVEVLAISLFHESLFQVIVSLNLIFGILAAILVGLSLYVTRPVASAISRRPGL